MISLISRELNNLSTGSWFWRLIRFSTAVSLQYMPSGNSGVVQFYYQ